MIKKLLAAGMALCSIFAFASCAKEEAKLAVKEEVVKMEVGGKHTVELEKKIDGVEWTSEDSKVATVSPEGVITAVRSGVTVVSARTDNSFVHIGVTVKGNGEYVDKNGNVVEVFDGVSDITEIVVGVKGGGKNDISVRKGDTYQLRAYTTPSDSKDKIVWKTSNSSVATVSEKGEMKITGTGKVTITAYAPNGVKGEMIVRAK